MEASLHPLALALACLAFLPPLQAFGAEAFPLLSTAQGGRAAGMAGAHGMVPGRAETLWYNPAAAAGPRAFDLSLGHASWIGDTSSEFAAVVFPTGLGSGAGAFINYAGTQDVIRDGFGTEQGSFGISAMAAGLAFGWQAGHLGLGASAKFLTLDFGQAKAAGFVGDAGLIASFFSQRLCLSVAGQNLAPSLAYSEAGRASNLGGLRPPMAIRAGLGIMNIGGFSLQQEFVQWLASGRPSYLAGLEYKYDFGSGNLALRAGYDTSLNSVGGAGGLHLGMGFGFGGLSLDYAFESLGDLGLAHRAFLGWRLGGEQGPGKATAPEAASAASAGEDKFKALMKAGNLAYKEGRFLDALLKFTAAETLQPRHYKVHYNLGATYFKLGRREEAKERLEQSLKLKPDQENLKGWMKEQGLDR